jgi:hypothetical protein
MIQQSHGMAMLRGSRFTVRALAALEPPVFCTQLGAGSARTPKKLSSRAFVAHCSAFRGIPMHQPERAHDPLSRRSIAVAESSAPTPIEYAIIAVLIAAVAVGTWKTFGEGVPEGPVESLTTP